MACRRLLHLLSLVFMLFATRSSAQCSTSVTFEGENRVFSNCNDLGKQGASIAWSLDRTNSTLQVLFSGVSTVSGGWVGWGINPTGLQMAGTQAFIAYQASNGSTVLTYSVTQATASGTPLKCSPISLHVLDMKVQISGTSVVTLVTVQLSPNQSTILNHVWNRGPVVSNFQPTAHSFASDDLSTLKSIDMSSGAAAVSATSSTLILKNRHGVLNTVAWGIMLPIGVMFARYLKPFTDPAWFYLHVFTQISGYAIGVAGWATGLKLGSESVGVVYTKHRSVGIAVFAIATLQVTAILLRPKKEHRIRKAWNWYHYTLGATILVLGILNIFFGFDILRPAAKWRRSYVGVLVALALLAVVFEVSSWIYLFMTRSRASNQARKPQGATVGGSHGYENGHSRAVA